LRLVKNASVYCKEENCPFKVQAWFVIKALCWVEK
jgi:hypothetical protein